MATLLEYVGNVHIFLGPYRGNPIALYLRKGATGCEIAPQVYPWSDIVGKGETPNRAAADFEEKWKANGLAPDMYTGPAWEGGVKPEKPKPAAPPKPAAAAGGAQPAAAPKPAAAAAPAAPSDAAAQASDPSSKPASTRPSQPPSVPPTPPTTGTMAPAEEQQSSRQAAAEPREQDDTPRQASNDPARSTPDTTR